MVLVVVCSYICESSTHLCIMALYSPSLNIFTKFSRRGPCIQAPNFAELEEANSVRMYMNTNSESNYTKGYVESIYAINSCCYTVTITV